MPRTYSPTTTIRRESTKPVNGIGPSALNLRAFIEAREARRFHERAQAAQPAPTVRPV